MPSEQSGCAGSCSSTPPSSPRQSAQRCVAAAGVAVIDNRCHEVGDIWGEEASEGGLRGTERVLDGTAARDEAVHPFWKLPELVNVRINGRQGDGNFDSPHAVGDTALFVVGLGGHLESLNLGGRPSSSPISTATAAQCTAAARGESNDYVEYPLDKYCPCAEQTNVLRGTVECSFGRNFGFNVPYSAAGTAFEQFESVGNQFFDEVLCGRAPPTTPTTTPATAAVSPTAAVALST